MRARRRKIQLPYPNTHETIWEYKESFLSRQIDFFSFIGAACPVCGKQDCYREITPYWRYAIDLFPEFKKERVPVARFLCDKRERTFSILPSQLMPYFQYTVNAVIGTLLLVLHYRQMGQKGLHGASVAVDPDTLLTPWLIACWLGAVVLGFRRAHGVLRQWYNLADIRSSHGSAAWEEASGYFLCFGWHLQIRWGPPDVVGPPPLQSFVNRYSRSTRLFLFGTPSQYRVTAHP
jgi:hypothetical protein